MNENEFAHKLRPWLDRSAAAVDELRAARLKATRLRALDAMPSGERRPGLVPAAPGAARAWRYALAQRCLLWLPIAALTATLWFQAVREQPDPGALDAQLLTQELPPDAFLDQDLREWVAQPQG